MMNINYKQKEIIDDFFNKAKEKFPEIEFKELVTNPDDPEHIWVIVSTDMDEKREDEFIDFEIDYESNIHLNLGHRISMMLQNERVFA